MTTNSNPYDKDYFSWHKTSKIGGNIPFSKGLISALFENITNE
ncbi:MAG: hypothetical protein WAM88_07045 [Nitrososphaeraceae archaeon]